MYLNAILVKEFYFSGRSITTNKYINKRITQSLTVTLATIMHNAIIIDLISLFS